LIFKNNFLKVKVGDEHFKVDLTFIGDTFRKPSRVFSKQQYSNIVVPN
jgi:hypothetical protein